MALANLLQSTQRFKKDTPEMLRELKFFLKKKLQGMIEKVQQLKDKHVELFFTPVTEFAGDELDLMKKWTSSHWETNLMHDPGPAPLKAVQVSFTGIWK